jgi:hypothetical protein
VVDDKAGRDGLLVGEPLLAEIAEEPVGERRRVAEAELLDRLRRDPAAREVCGRGLARLGPAQRLAEVEVRRLVRGEEPLLVLALLRRAPRQLDAGALREDAERLDRLEPLLLLEPGERIPRRATPEALEGPSLRIDVERGRLLRVEGADANVTPTRALQRDLLADQLDEVDPLLDEVEVAGRVSGAPTRPGRTAPRTC